LSAFAAFAFTAGVELPALFASFRTVADAFTGVTFAANQRPLAADQSATTTRQPDGDRSGREPAGGASGIDKIPAKTIAANVAMAGTTKTGQLRARRSTP